ncbi:PDDEXK nuclease domain-containing protein, partial [Oribacterium sp. HCP3S3_B9]|uniref:PDDEXK nuclease domain-containing protein n=1 Tax=Oribacterium sp. HCP3S3_B9 TaxID=3438946 RepID=UPI003F88AE71
SIIIKEWTTKIELVPTVQKRNAAVLLRKPGRLAPQYARERYDEKELKDALIEKVNNFLMELGTGFAYMGREVRIEVGDTEKFIDMLFYNTQRHCYVVVEIKTGKFDSSYAGQLGTYVVAINHQMKTEADNPTLGLLICKDMDKVEAQYALESTSQPLGISSYELSKLIPEEFRGSMPTIEEIEAELNE